MVNVRAECKKKKGRKSEEMLGKKVVQV